MKTDNSNQSQAKFRRSKKNPPTMVSKRLRKRRGFQYSGDAGILRPVTSQQRFEELLQGVA